MKTTKDTTLTNCQKLANLMAALGIRPKTSPKRKKTPQPPVDVQSEIKRFGIDSKALWARVQKTKADAQARLDQQEAGKACLN